MLAHIFFQNIFNLFSLTLFSLFLLVIKSSAHDWTITKEKCGKREVDVENFIAVLWLCVHEVKILKIGPFLWSFVDLLVKYLKAGSL